MMSSSSNEDVQVNWIYENCGGFVGGELELSIVAINQSIISAG
jgi:hypothetical protein